MKCSAVVWIMTLCSVVGLSMTAKAEGYYGDQDYIFYEDSSVEYIPPESDGNDYFDIYHEDADDYYDDNFYSNEQSYEEYSEEETEETESEEEQDGYTDEDSQLMEQYSVDTNELTSKDWENIQKTLNSKGSDDKNAAATANGESSIFINDSGNDDFGTMKEKSESNDVGQYLVYGILLLLAGITIVVAVIVINVKANKKARTAKKIKENPVDPLSVSLRDVQRGKNKTSGRRRKSAIGGRHAAGRRTYYSESMQSDLVDLLDDPKNLDYTGEI